MSIGSNPTVNGESRTVETHLLDFNETLYAQKITVEFTHHLRGMLKFNGLEELKAAMAADEQKARALFAEVEQ
jgi:riboflavin kinase/FMN adenylyltransferase